MRQHPTPRRKIAGVTDARDEEGARTSPRAVAAAAILVAVVLGAVVLFLAVLFSRACA
jgi:hypothetical protein